MYTHFASSLMFPLHERLKGHDTVRRLRDLERTQWWPSIDIETLREERLRQFLRHAAERVPYYRELYAQRGLSSGDLRTVTDLQRLPMLDKATIRNERERLRADDAGELETFSTGGSSGEPLTFYLGRERVSHDVAAKWRATRWWGVDIGDREAVVWGSPIELGSHGRAKALRDWLLRSRLYPAFGMSPEDMDRFLADIRQRRPHMLFGYPSALSLLAGHAEESGMKLDDIGVRVAFVTGERLYDEQAAQIRRIFGCSVANGYGGRDGGFIAHECPEGGLHVSAEDIVVEVVDAQGVPVPPGEAGELVVTHLATSGFPFIRYRTGDVGAMDTRACGCGRGLPLLRSLEGRETDFIITPDGTRMHGLALIYVLRDLPGIERFRIVQQTATHVQVTVIPGADWSEAVADRISEGIRERMGDSVEVGVECTDDIPAEQSGKYRYVVSHARSAA